MTENLPARSEGAAPLPALPERRGNPARGAGVDALTLARNMDGLLALGRTLLKSGLLPDALRTPEAVVAVVIKGQELDVPPMHALSHIVIIKGKPTMSAELMRALVLRAGHRFRIVESTRERATVEGVRRDDPEHPTRMSFDAEDVRTAGLAGQSGHQKYPAALKLARATSALCRAVFADAIGGIGYTPEELGAEVDEEGRVVERAPVREIRSEAEPPEEAEVVEEGPDGRHGGVMDRVKGLLRRLPEDAAVDAAQALEYAGRSYEHAVVTERKLRRMAGDGDPAEEEPAPHPDEVEGVERGGAGPAGAASGGPASREQLERLRALAFEIVEDGDGAAKLEEMIGKRLEDLTREEAEEWLGRLRGERS